MCPEAFGEEGAVVTYDEVDDEDDESWAPNMIYLQQQLENVGKKLVVLSQKVKASQALILLIGLPQFWGKRCWPTCDASA